MTLGGISMPNTELPATTPTANRGVYPKRIISGTATRVNTEADAMLTPVIAANTAFAATVAKAREFLELLAASAGTSIDELKATDSDGIDPVLLPLQVPVQDKGNPVQAAL